MKHVRSFFHLVDFGRKNGRLRPEDFFFLVIIQFWAEKWTPAAVMTFEGRGVMMISKVP